MKKTTKRVLSLVMAVVMLFTLASVAVLAATADSKYQNYVALGDSIPGGFSMQDYLVQAKTESDRTGTEFCIDRIRVANSYPDLIGKNLGLDERNEGSVKVMCKPGFRTTDFRILLEDNYNGDYITATTVPGYSGNDNYYPEKIALERDDYREAIEKADLVTLDIGFNDTWLPFVGACQNIMDANPQLDFETIMKLPKYTNMIVNSIFQMTVCLYTNYDKLVKDIYRINPSVTIVAVGCYNPFKDWTFPDGSFFRVGPLLQPLYNKINLWKMHYEKLYNTRKNTRYIFVNVPEPELISKSVNDLMAGFDKILKPGGWDPHPTAAGHEYIAQKILDKLGVEMTVHSTEVVATEAVNVNDEATA